MCARAKRPCSTLPVKEKKCLNTLLLRVDSVLDSSGRDGGVSHAKSDGLMKDHAKSGSLDDHVSLTAEARYDFCVNASSVLMVLLAIVRAHFLWITELQILH